MNTQPAFAQQSIKFTHQAASGSRASISSSKNGELVKLTSLQESKLQKMLLQHLRSREIRAEEGTEYGGGETDILLPEHLVIENKVNHSPTNDPFNDLFLWQARRYSASLLSKVSYGVIGYKPKDENGYLSLPLRIKVVASKGDDVHTQIQFAVPWGYTSPSLAKIPTQ